MVTDLELVQRLCVCAGAIMEDTSAEAVSILDEDPDLRRTRLAAMRQTALDIAALLCAAEVLNRRCGDGGNGIV